MTMVEESTLITRLIAILASHTDGLTFAQLADRYHAAHGRRGVSARSRREAVGAAIAACRIVDHGGLLFLSADEVVRRGRAYRVARAGQLVMEGIQAAAAADPDVDGASSKVLRLVLEHVAERIADELRDQPAAG